MIILLYLFAPSIIRTQLKPKFNLKTSRPETGDTHNNGHWLTHTITHQCWVLLWSAVPRVSSKRQGLARRAGSSRRGSRSRRRCCWPTSRRSSTEWWWSLRYSPDPRPFCWTQVFLFCSFSLTSDCLRMRRDPTSKPPPQTSYWSMPQGRTALLAGPRLILMVWTLCC